MPPVPTLRTTALRSQAAMTLREITLDGAGRGAQSAGAVVESCRMILTMLLLPTIQTIGSNSRPWSARAVKNGRQFEPLVFMESCSYCSKSTVHMVPPKGIGRALKRRGLLVNSPCCQDCFNRVTLFTGQSTRTASVFVRKELERAYGLLYSADWEENTELFYNAVAMGRRELDQTDREIKELLNALESLTKQRNKLFTCSEEISFTLQRRSAKAYVARRAIANAHISEPEVRDRIFSRDGWKCVQCGSLDDLTIDHKIPVLKNGPNDDWNLQSLCKTCNSSKGSRYEKQIQKKIALVENALASEVFVL